MSIPKFGSFKTAINPLTTMKDANGKVTLKSFGKNFLLAGANPGGQVVKQLQGKQNLDVDRSWLDPAGVFDVPEIPPPSAPPVAPNFQAEGAKARDRIRRQVYKAQGRSSTIRSPSAAGYSPEPKRLLGQ